jgi:hypothetical protein
MERKCDSCGTAWLLTSRQARFSHRRARRPGGPGIGPSAAPFDEESVLGLAAVGSQVTPQADELLAVRDALRRCPKCGSAQFSDRRVTNARPALPGASRSELA